MKLINSDTLIKGLRFGLKHWKYIPTAIHALFVLNQANILPWPKRDRTKKTFAYPFDSPKEKKELIKRANWLCKEVIVKDPEELITKMPDAIGRHFQGEWAIYACSMTACALCNLIRLYPELRDEYLEKARLIIDQTNTPTIRYYDTVKWGEDAMETLGGLSSHVTYLSILAWMIGNYRLAGGDGFSDLHKALCETLNRRMLASHDLNLPSYPDGVIYLPDMMFAGLALKDYDALNGATYTSTLDKWLDIIKSRYINPETGLMASTIFQNHTFGRTSGAYSALNTTGAVLLDEDFGSIQFNKLKQHFAVSFAKFAAIKECTYHVPRFYFDIDAGPVIYGISPSGTAFAIGAATFLGDWELRHKLLCTASLAGGNASGKREQHYRLAEIMLTGEAITLAMRTMVNFEKRQ